MLEPTLEYQPPHRDWLKPDARVVWKAAALVAGIILTINVGMVFGSIARRFDGIGIMVVIGPVTNFILASFSLIGIPTVRRSAGGVSIAPYVLASTLLPVAAVFIDGVCIYMSGTGAC